MHVSLDFVPDPVLPCACSAHDAVSLPPFTAFPLLLSKCMDSTFQPF